MAITGCRAPDGYGCGHAKAVVAASAEPYLKVHVPADVQTIGVDRLRSRSLPPSKNDNPHEKHTEGCRAPVRLPPSPVISSG